MKEALTAQSGLKSYVKRDFFESNPLCKTYKYLEQDLLSIVQRAERQHFSEGKLCDGRKKRKKTDQGSVVVDEG